MNVTSMRAPSVRSEAPYLNYRAQDTQSKEQPSPSGSSSEQSDEEKLTIRQLINTEKKVVAHEQAHMSVGGQYAGAANYGYTEGPDGKRYISSGEVSISIPSSDKPEQLIPALRQVIKAAMAPADPSPQDMKVAQSANAKLVSISAELSAKRGAEAYASAMEKSLSSGGAKKTKDTEPYAQATSGSFDLQI